MSDDGFLSDFFSFTVGIVESCHRFPRRLRFCPSIQQRSPGVFKLIQISQFYSLESYENEPLETVDWIVINKIKPISWFADRKLSFFIINSLVNFYSFSKNAKVQSSHFLKKMRIFSGFHFLLWWQIKSFWFRDFLKTTSKLIHTENNLLFFFLFFLNNPKWKRQVETGKKLITAK